MTTSTNHTFNDGGYRFECHAFSSGWRVLPARSLGAGKCPAWWCNLKDMSKKGVRTFGPGMCMKTKKQTTNCPRNMRTRVSTLLDFAEKRDQRGLLPHQIDGIAMQRGACIHFICVGLNPRPSTQRSRRGG